MRTCPRCEKIKPRSSFHLGKGHCADCRREAAAKWRETHHPSILAHRQLRKQKVDALAHAKLHCEHVANYTKRAIERFEKATGNESPPELTALYQLARRLSAEQENRMATRAISKACLMCDTPFKPTSATNIYCSTRCKEKAKRIRRGDYPKPSQFTPTDLDRMKIQGRKQYRAIRSDIVRIMRLAGMKWQDISDAAGLSGPGHAYLIVHPQQPRHSLRPVPSGTITNANGNRPG